MTMSDHARAACQARFLCLLAAVCACTAGPAPAEVGMSGPGTPEPKLSLGQQDAAAKLHPTLLRRLADEGGPVKAWVFFTDKGIEAPETHQSAISRVAATYNRRAVQRRMRRGTRATLFDAHDLPVAKAYVDGVAATGARVHVTSSWVNAVSVWATRDEVHRIATLPYVKALQPVARALCLQRCRGQSAVLHDRRRVLPVGAWPRAGCCSLRHRAVAGRTKA